MIKNLQGKDTHINECLSVHSKPVCTTSTITSSNVTKFVQFKMATNKKTSRKIRFDISSKEKKRYKTHESRRNVT